MGVISSIFGERPSAPQTGGFTVGAEIPKELAPYYKDILGKSQALYNESVSRGYEPYTGPSLAEFTPEQQQAFTGIAGLQGQQAPVYQEAMGMTRDAAAPITTEQIEEYMNPYQQAVVDIEKREAQKQYESQVVPQLAAKAAMAQPFGGSRQAILEGMAADTQQRLLGDIQAKGSAQAYQDAVNLLQNQRDRLGSGAGQLATLGSNQFKSQLGEIGALQTVGEEKQQLAQQALNEAYGQYIKEQEYPYQQLGRYQSVVTGAPIQQTQYVPPTPPGPSVGQQLLGGAATMLGTYGAFGGKMPQLFGTPTQTAKTGGGIGDLPVIKAQQNKYLKNYLYNTMDPIPSDYVTPDHSDFSRTSEAIRAAKLKAYNYEELRRRKIADMYGTIDPSGAIQNISEDENKRRLQEQDITDPLKGYPVNVIKDNIEPVEDFGNLTTVFTKEKTNKKERPLTLDQKALKALGLPYTPDNVNKLANMPIEYIKKLAESTKEAAQSVVEDFKTSFTVDKQPLSIRKPNLYPEGGKKEVVQLPGERFIKETISPYVKEYIEKEKKVGDKIYNYLNKLDILKKKDRVTPTEIKEILSKDTSFLADFYKQQIGEGNKKVDKEVQNKAEKILMSPVPLKDQTGKDEKIKSTITTIVENKTPVDNKINKDESKALKAQVDYGNLITKKEQGDKVPKTDLASAQDKYLEAVKKMNEGLDKKDALIGKAQQESFWAFVARVGANISKGAGISESVGAELPQAMKDRQSLIQAKSDLDDKKLAGKVDVAKAGVDIESSRVKAKIATEAEAQRRKEKGTDQFINWTDTVLKNKGKVIPYKLATKAMVDQHGDMIKDTIETALKMGDTRFNAPTILNEKGVAYTGKNLAKNITKISKDSDFHAAVLSNYEQLATQYAEDGVINKSMDDIMVEAVNNTMTNLPTKFKRKPSAWWR